MEVKDTGLTELQVIRACKTGLPSNAPWEDICLAQAERTEAMLKERWKQEGRREVIEWADKLCPHGTLSADTSRAYRRECEICWQAKLKKWALKELNG